MLGCYLQLARFAQPNWCSSELVLIESRDEIIGATTSIEYSTLEDNRSIPMRNAGTMLWLRSRAKSSVGIEKLRICLTIAPGTGLSIDDFAQLQSYLMFEGGGKRTRLHSLAFHGSSMLEMQEEEQRRLQPNPFHLWHQLLSD